MENFLLPCTDMVVLVIIFVTSILITRLCIVFLVNPRLIRSKITNQGFKGPPPSFIMGNIPEMKRIMSMSSSLSSSSSAAAAAAEVVVAGKVSKLNYADASALFPHFKQWTKQYGETFTFSLGTVQLLYVGDTNIVREINQCKSLDLGKPCYLQKDRGPLLGKGLITTSGLVWLHQRKTIAPQLYTDKVKGMLNVMRESAIKLVESWESIVETSKGGIADISVDDHVRSFTSYIISRAMFGTNNHSLGIQLFPKCRALMKVLQTPTVLTGIPFIRHLPTKNNKQVWRLEKEIYSMIMEVAKARSGDDDDDDMLRTIVEGTRNGGELGPSTAEEFVVDNCKDIYLAAFEVTAVAAIWGLMLLASHPEWQARVRQEVVEICGGKLPDANMLNKMKVLRMVIQEVLRLYPGVAFVSRQALQDVQLGGVCVPKSVCVWIWIPALHRDPQLWGPDADEFNPERFANGISGACKSPQAYIPFGVGARICPGQSLAIAEMKVLFALILSKFSLSISPKYRHSPTLGLLLEPEHGVNLLIQKI